MTERNYAWYKFDGQEGILAYPDTEKFKNIEPVEKGESLNFYALADLGGIEITGEDVCGVLSDSYGVGCANKGGNIGEYLVTNPENEQKSMYAWEYDDVHEDDEAVRQLCTFTTQYHDWTSELTEFVDSAIHHDWKTKEELENEWKEISKNYKFHFSEPLDFAEIWEKIEDGRS